MDAIVHVHVLNSNAVGICVDHALYHIHSLGIYVCLLFLFLFLNLLILSHKAARDLVYYTISHCLVVLSNSVDYKGKLCNPQVHV